MYSIYFQIVNTIGYSVTYQRTYQVYDNYSTITNAYIVNRYYYINIDRYTMIVQININIFNKIKQIRVRNGQYYLLVNI